MKNETKDIVYEFVQPQQQEAELRRAIEAIIELVSTTRSGHFVVHPMQ